MTNKEAIEILSCYYERGNDRQNTAMDMAIEALEKQVPMPVKTTTSTKRCRSCGRQLSGIGNLHPERKYCVKCGQAIDWSES